MFARIKESMGKILRQMDVRIPKRKQWPFWLAVGGLSFFGSIHVVAHILLSSNTYIRFRKRKIMELEQILAEDKRQLAILSFLRGIMPPGSESEWDLVRAMVVLTENYVTPARFTLMLDATATVELSNGSRINLVKQIVSVQPSFLCDSI